MAEVLDDQSRLLDVRPDEHPVWELLRLAGPTVAQMVSYTVMQFIDTWMLAKALGPMAPAAASNAGSLSFAFIGDVLEAVDAHVLQHLDAPQDFRPVLGGVAGESGLEPLHVSVGGR